MLRPLFYFLAGLILAELLLSACSKEQQHAQDQPVPTQTSSEVMKSDVGPDTAGSEKAASATVHDTTLAGKYLLRASELVKDLALDSARVYYEKAAGLYEKEAVQDKYIFCLNNIGIIFSRQGEFERARSHLHHALEIGVARLGKQRIEVANIHNTLSIVHFYKGEYEQALQFSREAVNIYVAVVGPRHARVAAAYMNAGMFYSEKSEYDQALAYYKKALDIQLATLGERSRQVTNTFHNMGIALSNKGDYEQALTCFEKSLAVKLALSLSQKPDEDVANGYHEIAMVRERKGDYEQALAFYEKALAIKLAAFGPQHPQAAITYSGLGLVSLYMKEYDRALDYLKRQIAITSAISDEQHPDLCTAYNVMGRVYFEQGDYDQAMAYYHKALAIARSVFREKHVYVANSYTEIGHALRKKDRRHEALSFYQKGLTVARDVFGEVHPTVAEICIGLGSAYQDQGGYDRALDYLQQSLRANIATFKNTDPYANPPLHDMISERELLNALQNKAEVFARRYVGQSHDLKDLKTSVSTYQLAAQLIDQMRRGYKTEGAKLFLAAEAAGIYGDAIRSALQLYAATRQAEPLHTAFQFAENSKAGVMLEALAELEARQFAGIPDSLLAQEKQLRIDLNFYESSLAEEQFKREESDSAKIAQWKDRLFGFRQAYDKLLTRFEQEYPGYYNLKYQIKTASVPEVQQLLDDQTALVEYFTGRDSIYIFALTKSGFDIKTSPKDSSLENQITQLRHGIITQDFALYAPVAYRLYLTLLAPAADQLKSKNLIIVPDGVLSAIPFETLLTAQVEAKGNLQDYVELPYLVRECAISYAYSATLLQQEQSRKNREAKHDYLAFAPVFASGLPAGTRSGDFFTGNLTKDSSAASTRIRGYLPATKKEVTGILACFENSYGWFERWFGNKARVYLEREANEENLKSPKLGDYRYLHFATHGLINEKSPKLSGLLLAQKDSISREDGILHLGEIYNLNLNADLVVLSACETGLGQVAKGEGIIGLTRGFLYAGASNLLVSLWQVSDVTTADLMVDFYDKMLGGMSKAEALAEAKRQMIRRDPGYAKPYYWAPFILVGR